VNQIKSSVIAQAKSVGHVQTPAIYDQSVGTFMFTAGARPAPADNTIRPNPVLVAPELTAAQLEEKFWDEARAAGNKEAFEAYLSSYPRGRYVSLARANIARLSSVQVVTSPPVVAPPVTTRPVNPPAILAPATTPEATFKDCDDCPDMVVIPAGRHLMGSKDASSEQPQHPVTIQSFAMGTFEVTQEQWYAVMGMLPSGFKGRTLPVEKVSWDDAQSFAKKLSEKTGKNYRLPSESEWEYAARAGSQTNYYFGDNENDLGRYAWFSGNSGNTTHPVGEKAPNAFGLHDMLGNVWEWTADCWNDSYNGAPSDGRAWTSGFCGQRVVRGGAWSYKPQYSRSAWRGGVESSYRGSYGGFRLARLLP